MKGKDWLDKTAEHLGSASDYRLAKLLGVSKAAISKQRQGRSTTLDDDAGIRLALDRADNERDGLRRIQTPNGAFSSTRRRVQHREAVPPVHQAKTITDPHLNGPQARHLDHFETCCRLDIFPTDCGHSGHCAYPLNRVD